MHILYYKTMSCEIPTRAWHLSWWLCLSFPLVLDFIFHHLVHHSLRNPRLSTYFTLMWSRPHLGFQEITLECVPHQISPTPWEYLLQGGPSVCEHAHICLQRSQTDHTLRQQLPGPQFNNTMRLCHRVLWLRITHIFRARHTENSLEIWFSIRYHLNCILPRSPSNQSFLGL